MLTHHEGDKAISNGLFKDRLNKAINERLTKAKKDLDKSFKYRRGHAMTNHYYITTLQKAEEVERRKVTETLQKFSLSEDFFQFPTRAL